MTIEDSLGRRHHHRGHCAPGPQHPTEEFLFTATDFNSYVTVSTADGAPQRQDGRMRASESPGLGVEPRPDVLGEALVDVSA